MKIGNILSSAFATWFVGMALFLLLFVPIMKALIFVLECVFWLFRAWQAFTTGMPMPCFRCDDVIVGMI